MKMQSRETVRFEQAELQALAESTRPGAPSSGADARALRRFIRFAIAGWMVGLALVALFRYAR